MKTALAKPERSDGGEADRLISSVRKTVQQTSRVDLAAAVDRRDARSVVAGREGMECLLAPLRHGALITKSHAKSEQLAGMRGGCGAWREAFFQNPFVAR